MSQLSPVQFHGDTIFVISHQNEPYTPVKPIVENMGLAWQTQARKLTDNKDRWGIVMMVIPSESGPQQTLCMPVRKLPAFLASINPKKVRPELRERIELYQNECDDALWDYWTKGQATRNVELPTTLLPSQRAELKAIVDAKLSTYPDSVQGKARAEIWTRFNRHFKIAEYAQLSPALMPEARDYLVELKPKALPQALPASEADRDPYAAIQRKMEALRVRTRADASALYSEIMALDTDLGVEIHAELCVPVLNWLHEAITSPWSATDPLFNSSSTPLMLIKTLNRRLAAK